MEEKTARTELSPAGTKALQGLLLVDKPAGMTSHDVVQRVRRIYAERSIGHLGTLDPFATGLLVLLLGRATRLAGFLETEPKVYEAAISFGAETDTDDATGSVIRSAPVPEERLIREGIGSLTGTLSQVPPNYSAKSVDGTRAYDAARRGEPIKLAAVSVQVHGWEVRKLTTDRLDATISCSTGTYIRALARDLGRATGSAAHLAALRRTRIGTFDVGDAATLDTLGENPPAVTPLRVVTDG